MFLGKKGRAKESEKTFFRGFSCLTKALACRYYITALSLALLVTRFYRVENCTNNLIFNMSCIVLLSKM